MALTRLFVAVALLDGFAGPIGLVVVEAVSPRNVTEAASESGRILGLAANTLALAGGAVVVAVPAGVAAAVALERMAVPGRTLIRGLVVVGLFVPLPVYAVAWQVVLGTWLPPLNLEPGQVAWRPWAQGLVPAAWVHGTAGLPWVVWIVGAGLKATDRGLEDDALLSGGPGVVFRRVLLPRAVVAGLAATAWVAVQAATEITVSDAMMVRTFAEEVYTQFVGASDGLAGAVAVAVPAWLLSGAVAGVVVYRTGRAFGEPPADAGPPTRLRLPLGVRILSAVVLWAGVTVFAGLPFAALAWRAGGGGTRSGWNVPLLGEALEKVVRADGAVLAGSAGAATVAGALTVVTAWLACWLATGSRWFTRFLFGLCVVLWVTPGPLVGLGLKAAIDALIEAEEWAFERTGTDEANVFLRPLLYDQPSPVPAVWAAVLRLFPVAVAVLWPAFRAIPRGLLDAAKLDGLGVRGEWRCVVVPFTGPTAARAAVAVAALALAEVSATKLVNPPGRSAYVLRLFDQMHYGAESTVAALALLQIAATAVAAGLLLWTATPEPRSRDGRP